MRLFVSMPLLLIYILIGLFSTHAVVAQVPGRDTYLMQYVPGSGQETDTVRLNFIFIMQADSNGHFHPPDSEYLQYIDDGVKMINWLAANHAYTASPDKCKLNDPAYPNTDTRIRFSVHKIFIEDTTGLWDNGNKLHCPGPGDWLLAPVSKAVNRDSSIAPAINILFSEWAEAVKRLEADSCDCAFFTEHVSETDCSQFPKMNKNYELQVHMRNEYAKYLWMKKCAVHIHNQPWKEVVYKWALHGFARLTFHELGHNFGLGHTGCACPDNLMFNSACPGTGGLHLTATQIGLMRYHLFNSCLIKYLESPLYVHTEPDKDYVVDSSQVWQIGLPVHHFRGNATLLAGLRWEVQKTRLVLPIGGTLHIYGTMVLKDGAGISVWNKGPASIILYNGAELIIHEGTDIREMDNISIEKHGDARLIIR